MKIHFQNSVFLIIYCRFYLWLWHMIHFLWFQDIRFFQKRFLDFWVFFLHFFKLYFQNYTSSSILTQFQKYGYVWIFTALFQNICIFKCLYFMILLYFQSYALSSKLIIFQKLINAKLAIYIYSHIDEIHKVCNILQTIIIYRTYSLEDKKIRKSWKYINNNSENMDLHTL